MLESTKSIPVERLRGTVKALFCAAGMSDGDSEVCVDNLLTANLWGIDSHGVIRVPLYIDRIRQGGINVAPKLSLIDCAGGLAVLEADGAAGAVAGTMAMREAIRLAKANGIAAVGVRNSNHFGAAGYYARMAVKQGMIGVSMTNVTRLIAAQGSVNAIAGNNPFSIGVPTYDEIPFLLDMAVSRVANGKLILAEKKGEKIPLDWATDADGNPTDDPVEAQKGFLLPMGDYKGLILAYAIDILCGVITGTGFANGVVSMYKRHDLPSRVGHMMIAIDIDSMISRDDMKEKMRQYREFLKSQPMRHEDDELLFPGELEHRSMLERSQNGIPVPLQTINEINALCKAYGVNSVL